ncbi:hypothetical protein BJ138DRAFT_1197791 [Hygrophoropsis aurantiaca]|uniref:Uncharacterized protein n=1 Tax=Hygrophoropsis aurantiaca TaxID=72124 RepID=A0ACB7ZQF1_9AGAM|nr:hypothetical protein BJ138DRAFT_1197791 [Hygrophoropsis aurantiaca]
MPRIRNRWSHDDENPGSMFHELVVLPTLNPDIARPEYHNTTGPVIYPQPRSQQLANGILMTSGSTLSSGEQPQGHVAVLPPESLSTTSVVDEPANKDDDRLFYLEVTLERIEQTFTTRGPGKPKIITENKLGPKLALLKLSRAEIVREIYSVHGLEDRYVAGPVAGPPFRISCKGFTGGQKKAPTIRLNDEWSTMIDRLSTSKSSVDTVQIILAMKDLEPYKDHKRAASPDPLEETTYGTNVPSKDSYSAVQRAIGHKITQLKSDWPCAKHGQCYIDTDGEHIALSRFRLNAWASAMAGDKNLLSTDPPPHELLLEWRGSRSVDVPTPKPRGRQGPHLISASASGGSDIGTIFATIATPFVKSLASMAVASLAPTSPSSSHRLSSPPPAFEDELTSCLTAFASARKLSITAISSAQEGLEGAAYTPDIMGEVLPTRIQELTGLAEGHAIALHKFAREWCGKVDAKRARRA